MDTKKETFESFIKRNQDTKKILQELRHTKYENLKKEQDELNLIDKQFNDIDSILRVYSQLNLEKVSEMDEITFHEIIYPLSKYYTYHEDLLRLNDMAKKQLSNETEIYHAISIISGSTAATPTNASIIALSNLSFFNDSTIIKTIYDKNVKFGDLENSITRINKELPFLLPDISSKFIDWMYKVNLKALYSPTCGELVDLRTLIYYELYRSKGAISDINYGIKKFIFGCRIFDTSCDSLIVDAKKIWVDLSGDIKKGKASETFRKAVFYDLIFNLDQIILSRKRLYSK